MYVMWHTMSANEVAEKLKVDVKKGLTEEEAEKRLQQYGENKLKDKKKESIVIRFFKQFQDFMILILIAAPVAKVRRNGKLQTIESKRVVPGDIVLLEAGNYVPADCRLLSSSHLKIEESALTRRNRSSRKKGRDYAKPKSSAW